jgi:hypothetical protein
MDPGPEPIKHKARRYNWLRLKTEYVEGISDPDGRVRWPTYEEVAERNNVLARNIRRRAAQEHWTDERATFQRRIELQRRTERSTELATLGADLDVNALRIARNGMAVAAARLQELGMQSQLRTEALRQSGGAPAAGTPPAVDSDEVRILARAATDWYDLGTKALGDIPHAKVELEASLAVDASIDVTMDGNERTARILTILNDAGVLNGRGHAGGAAEVGALEVGPGADASGQPLHPPDAHDAGEPEPQANGLSASG